MPFPSPPMYADPSSEHARRGAFATRQLWVTPYSDSEKYPAGQYPLHVGDSDGIVQWTSMVCDASRVACRSMAYVPALDNLVGSPDVTCL